MNKKYQQDPKEEALERNKANKLLQKTHNELLKFDASIRLDVLTSLIDAVFDEIKTVVTKQEYKGIVKEILKHLKETNK